MIAQAAESKPAKAQFLEPTLPPKLQRAFALSVCIFLRGVLIKVAQAQNPPASTSQGQCLTPHPRAKEGLSLRLLQVACFTLVCCQNACVGVVLLAVPQKRREDPVVEWACCAKTWKAEAGGSGVQSSLTL